MDPNTVASVMSDCEHFLGQRFRDPPVKSLQSCPTLWIMVLQAPLCLWDSPDKNWLFFFSSYLLPWNFNRIFMKWKSESVNSLSCVWLCDSMDCSPPGSSVHGIFPGKNTGVGCHFLLQGVFPTQGLNLGLLHCRWILYCLSHQGSPRTFMQVIYFFSMSIFILYHKNKVSTPSQEPTSGP